MVMCLYLLWGAWQDFQKRRISNHYLLVGGSLGIILRMIDIVWNNCSWQGWIWALLPGVLLLIFAKITKEKIGMGDGWVILILGNYLSLEEIWYVLQMALMVVLAVFVIKLCRKKIDKEYEMPFLPFLWIVYTFLWGIGYV